jgi:hypothetical protein
VDDYPQLNRLVPENEDPNNSRPQLRTSLAWVGEWGREGVRDVLLEVLLASGVEVPAPEWDPLNARALAFLVRHGRTKEENEREKKYSTHLTGDERGARKLCGRFGRMDEALLKESLVGALPHAQTAVLWELAKAGVHPFG